MEFRLPNNVKTAMIESQNDNIGNASVLQNYSAAGVPFVQITLFAFVIIVPNFQN